MSFPYHGTPDLGCSGACCLRVEGLGVKLESETILQNISFHLHCGEMVALIGPNGSGKTSLFQSILGQLPYTGKITFERPGTGPSRPLIGYVPQSPAFDSRVPVSVLDFFAAAISPWPVFLPIPSALRARVRACLDRVQGDSLLNKRIGALSGGELQRVLLAMALEPLPQILILDEPLSGVDVEGEHQLMELLQEIRHAYDLSIFFSTHDFQTLSQYADKVMLLQRGLRKVGKPQEVLQSPEFQEAFGLNLPRKGGWSE